MNQSARTAIGVLALVAVASSPLPSRASGSVKAAAVGRPGAPGRPGQLVPLPPSKKPGEIRIKIFGRSSKEVAGTLQAQFQLYRAGAPVFRDVAWLNGAAVHNPHRGNADEIAYAEGEYLYVKGLQPGVYDLHLLRIPSYPPFRPVHIDGIVVEGGRIAELEDLQMELGEKLLQIGTPALLPEPAVNVVDRLNALLEHVTALQARADALEQASAELRKENAELKRRLEALEPAVKQARR